MGHLQLLIILAKRAACRHKYLQKGNYAFGGHLMWRLETIRQVSYCNQRISIWDDRLQEQKFFQQLSSKAKKLKQ